MKWVFFYYCYCLFNLIVYIKTSVVFLKPILFFAHFMSKFATLFDAVFYFKYDM